MFTDRRDAGEKLANLIKSHNIQDSLVIGVPRGGVIVAEPVARLLKAKMDIVISRKIGAPYNPEVAIGAVTPDGRVRYDERICEALKLKQDLLSKLVNQAKDEILRRISAYGRNPEELILQDKNVIVVDDGIATGFTLLATLEYIKRQKPKELILAVPVCPEEVAPQFIELVDKFYCILKPEVFYAVGQFYEEFGEVEDSEVLKILDNYK